MIIRIDEYSDVPIYMQIRNQIVMGISSGELKPGEQLPTVRALALEIGINTMTVSKTYQLLKQEGYIQTDRRSGATVAGGSSVPVSKDTLNALRLNISELRLSGLSKEKIMELCEKLYEEGMK